MMLSVPDMNLPGAGRIHCFGAQRFAAWLPVTRHRPKIFIDFLPEDALLDVMQL